MFEALNLNTEQVHAQEENIRQRVRELDADSRKRYFDVFSKEMKDPDTYAVLNFFFLTGLHHMYLGKFTRGAINLAIFLSGIALCLSGAILLGALAIGFILCVELMALFRSQVVVTDHNNQVSEAILQRL